MKKIFRIFVACLVVVAAASCTRELIAPENEDNNNQEIPEGLVRKEFSATVEEVGVKSDISGSFVLWEAGDEIAVYDGTATIKKFTAASIGSGGKTCSFQGDAAEAASYVAVAPYSVVTNLHTDSFSLTMPSLQKVKPGHSVDSEALISIAETTDNTLSFSNHFALVKVTLSRTDVVSVLLKGNNSESITGTVEYVVSTQSLNLSDADGSEVRLVHQDADGNADAFPAGDYYIAIWPTTFSNGFKLILSTTDGSKTCMSSSSSLSIDRNNGSNFQTIDDKSTFCPPTITTAQQLKMWRRCAEGYAVGETVQLGADVDLGEGGDAYDWETPSEFCGTFNGQGYKIYNFTVNTNVARSGFLGTLSEGGVFKNTVFGSSDGTTADGKSSITMTCNEGSWKYTGLIGYVSKKAVVQNVTNFVPVTADAAVTTKHAIGGIAGAAYTGAQINNCTNWANITDNSTMAYNGDAVCGMGGVLGQTGYTITISGCENKAKITNNCPGVLYLGGIIGADTGDGTTIQNCTNYGIVYNQAASGPSSDTFTVFLGGIAGTVGVNAKIIKCQNLFNQSIKDVLNDSADIEQRDSLATRAGLGGIVGGTRKSNVQILGCKNEGRPRINIKPNAKDVACGGIIGYSSSSILISKAADETPTENYYVKNIYKPGTTHATFYLGGIAGLLDRDNTDNIVEYCTNNGGFEFYDFCDKDGVGVNVGGIVGSTKGIVRYCTNNAYVFNRAKTEKKRHVMRYGGIAGGTKSRKPKEISNCTNNGHIGAQFTYGPSYFGGILATFCPDATVVRNCVNRGAITSSRYHGTEFYDTQGGAANSWLGGLFGSIEQPTVAVVNCEGCVIACDFVRLESNQYTQTGIIAGKLVNGSENKLTIGSLENPFKIVNTTRITTGTNARPTVLSDISGESPVTSVSIAYKHLIGTSNPLYDATAGSFNLDKFDFHIVVGTEAQAGI